MVSWRTSANATIEPTKAMTAATISARSKPAMNPSTPGRPLAWSATIAPIRAIPTEPPTCRIAFSTAEPTPDLCTGTARIAAAAVGVIAIAIPKPPRMKPGSRFQKSEVVLSCEK